MLLGSRLRPTPIWRLASDIHFPAGQGDAAERAAADIEGHSTAAKFSGPGLSVNDRASAMKEAAN